MKTLIVVVVLVMITGATGYSLWPKSNENWSGSWGIARPIVSDSISLSAAAPSRVEDENLPVRPKAKEPAPTKRKPRSPLTAQIQCAQGGERRTLAVIRQGTGCQLSYQKGSRAEIVAEATWGKQVCQQVRSQIVTKLRSAGYSCS